MPVNAAQKAAIEEIIGALLGMHAPGGKRSLCGMFLELVDREEWPQYYEVIPEPRCINKIKAGLARGRYKEASDVYTDLSLVFWNALFYNEPKSQIALDAETLKTTLENEWRKKTALGALPRRSPPPSSAQKVHGAVDQPEPGSQPTTSQPPTTTSTTNNASSGSNKMAQSSAKPVPIRPKQKQHTPDADVDIMTPDDGHAEDAVLERDPESEEIVKQLEKGLPRWPGFGEEGWMDDVPPDRLLDLVQAVKNYKDVAGLRPSSSLEAVPEGTTTPHLSYATPLSLKIIESQARDKKYANAKEFDIDVAKLFEKARRYYELCTEAYGHILLLQRLYQALTSPNPPEPPYVSTQNFAALRAGPGTIKPVHGSDTDGVPNVTTHRVLTRERKFVDEVHYRGWTLKLADWVHLSNPDDASRPIIAQVFRCWISEEPAKAGQAGITVSWYYRPEQTFHPAERRFWEGEVFKTSHFADHPVEDIIEKIACQFTARHIRGRPRPPYWYLGFPLYVCDSRYNDRDRVFVKIKNWNSCIPEEVRKSTEFMPIYPFERTVYPIRYPSPFLVKGNNGNKVKGPGGIIPSSSGDSGGGGGEVEVPDKNKNPSGVGKGDIAGSNKGQHQLAGNTTTTAAAATTQSNVVNVVSSVAPTPQPQYQQLVQQSQHLQHQHQPPPLPQRPPGPDRSVFTAAGGAALGSNIQIEKLPPETTKHFDRDPDTNEMLWFSAPPMNVSRVPPARHSLAYLHFLAMKRKQGERREGGGEGEEEEEEEGVMNVDEDRDDDGDGGEDGVRQERDERSSKRVKLESEGRMTTKEMMQKLWVEMKMDVNV